MEQVNIYEAKTHFSKYVEKVSQVRMSSLLSSLARWKAPLLD